LQTLHHTDSYEQQDSSASLYDDLLQCRHLLSNKEKLQLLHYGSLGAPAVSSMVTEWDDSSEADDLQDDSDSSGDTDSELTDDDEEEYWEVQQQQQQHAAGSDWRGLGEHGDTDMRQFDKQQVCIVLDNGMRVRLNLGNIPLVLGLPSQVDKPSVPLKRAANIAAPELQQPHCCHMSCSSHEVLV
jgi:hypothetical protein